VTDAYLPLLLEAIETRSPQIRECTIHFPDRDPVTVIAKYVPLLNSDQNIRQIIGLIFDITQLKKTEIALQKSLALIRKAFDNAPIGIALISPDGHYLEVNQALCEMLGYRQDELQSRHLSHVVHPDDWSMNWQGMQQLLAGETRIYQVEQRYVPKQDHDVYVSVNTSLVKDADRNPLYFIVQSQDISDRYKVDRMKDEFISIVSHELRTPLTAIVGSLGLVKAGVLGNGSTEEQEMVEMAYQNSDRLMRLVNDILDLERLESGQTELKMDACNISDLIEASVESVTATARGAGIILSTEALNATVWAAADAIIQTLTNLLSNAIKFSQRGSTVRITAQICEDDQGTPPITFDNKNPSPQVLISVKDQGRGIPADKHETIFGRFQQVDTSDSRQYRGTGLGLAICKSIVQQHGGQIWVESELGEGSTFYFTLPVFRQGNRG
jgi:PAS domain S-box-containing protein